LLTPIHLLSIKPYDYGLKKNDIHNKDIKKILLNAHFKLKSLANNNFLTNNKKGTFVTLSMQVESTWPQATHVMLCEDEKTLWGVTNRTIYEDATQVIEVKIGCCGGVSIAVLAHEAHHAARYIMADPKWSEFMPRWNNIRYQSEESISFIIERIVWQGLELIEKHGIQFANPLRQVQAPNRTPPA
jgi:hypothetical protein